MDEGPRGRLYEVPLPTDLEGMAGYVPVQDASTSWHSVLRVPPTVQTAAETLAWSFRLSAEAYGRLHET